MLVILIETIIATLFITIFILVDNYITHKNISINQREWDKYSKGMTNDEKMACFNEWLISQKNKT